jgi:hypothetical protein
LGLEDDYTTNPLLRVSGAEGEERVAAIIDLPLLYDTDELEFMLRPNGRITDKQGYSSLASNYEHLDASAQYTGDLDSATVQAELGRDSSLYYLGGTLNRIGVARDSVTGSGDWSRAMTERSQFEVDTSWTRVQYDEPSGFGNLVDYHYYQAGPAFVYELTERNNLKAIASYGDYQSSNGITQSKTESIQLGFTRHLSEIWTASASTGYTRSTNSEKVYFDEVYLLGSLSSTQGSEIYAVSLTRQGELLNLIANASRSLTPTGFAYLSRQDAFSLAATYALSERWDFAGSAAWVKALTPTASSGVAAPNGAENDLRELNLAFTANWHWTPQWVVSMGVTKISQQYGPPTVSAASTGISLSIVRHFLRIQF